MAVPTLALENLVVRLIGDPSSFNNMTRNFDYSMNRMAIRTAAYGRNMQAMIAIPVFLAAGLFVRSFAQIDAAITKSTNLFADFRKKTLGGPPGILSPATFQTRAREEIERNLFAISREGIFPVTQLAEAYGELGRSGMSAARGLDAVRIMQQFSIATSTDLMKSTEVLLGAQSALGMKSADPAKNLANLQRISEVVAAATTLPNVHAEEFAQGLARAGSFLVKNNVSLEEGAAILAIYNQKLITGAAAGDRLRLLLEGLESRSLKGTQGWKQYGQGLQDTTNRLHPLFRIHEQMGKGFHTQVSTLSTSQKFVAGFSTAWSRLGITMFDSAGKILPMSNVIRQLDSKFAGASDKEREMTQLLAGLDTRVVRALVPLLGMADVMERFEAGLKDVNGLMREMAERNMSTFSAAMSRLHNRITEVAYDFGKILLPNMQKMILIIEAMQTWWLNLNPAIRGTVVDVLIGIVAFTGLATALRIIGPIIGFLISPLTITLGLMKSLVFAAPALSVVLLGIYAIASEFTGKTKIGEIADEMKIKLDRFTTFFFGYTANLRENWKITMDWMNDHWTKLLDNMLENTGIFFRNILKKLLYGIGEGVSKAGIAVKESAKDFLTPKISGPTNEADDSLRFFQALFGRGGQAFGPAENTGVGARMAKAKGPQSLLDRIAESWIKLDEKAWDINKAMEPYKAFDKTPLPNFNLRLPFDQAAFGRNLPSVAATAVGFGAGPLGALGAIGASGASISILEAIKEGAEKGTKAGVDSSILAKPTVGDTFRSMNLRQFILEGPGGLVRSPLSAQNVTDKEAAQQRREMMTIMRSLWIGGMGK